MRKKFLSALLVLLLMVSSVAPAIMAEPMDALSPLPAVGEVVHGFALTELGNIDLIGAPTATFIHQKTGATLMYIQAKDIDRSFQIAFRTPPYDNTGVPHVFEHACLSGSEKFDYQNIVYALMSQAYSTYINASTYPDFTIYPVASLSEDQLYILTQVYMDAVLHPNILKDERIYRREAWRYELEDIDSPISLKGTVYSEMMGATTIDRTATLSTTAALMPGSMFGHESGGAPSDIPNLTYEQLRDFHETYYHPSNALILLYGELDYQRFLKMLDEEYLSAYDRAEIDTEDHTFTPIGAPVEKVIPFPTELGSPIEDASILTYAFSLDGATYKDTVFLNVLASLLNFESSSFMQSIRAQMPGKSIYAYVDTSIKPAVLMFYGENLNESDMSLFQTLCDDGLRDMVEQGIDMEALDSILASNRFSQLTLPEAKNLGVGLSSSLAMAFFHWNSLDTFNLQLEALDEIEAMAGSGILEDACRRLLLDNPQRALLATVPQPGLAEQNAEALATRLAEYKSTLSESELQALVEDTAALAAWSAEPLSETLVEQIKVLTTDRLPEEVDHFDVEDTTIDGVRTLAVETNAKGVNATGLKLDTSGILFEDLHYLKAYVNLIGLLGTDEHTREQMETLSIRYLNGLRVSANQYEDAEDVKRPVLSVDWQGLVGEYQRNLELIEELLFRTEFKDTAIMRNFLEQQRNAVEDSINNYPYNLLALRAFAAFDDANAYASYLDGLDTLTFLTDLLTQLDTNPEAVTRKFESIQSQLKNRQNAIATYASDAEGLKEIREHLPSFFARLPETEIIPADYSAIPRPQKREAIIVDSPVQYNLIYAPLELMNVELVGKFLPESTCLDDIFFMPKMRHELGCYATIISMDKDGFLFVTYRDPGLPKTFEAYDSLPAFLGSLEAIDLESYIISAYSSFAMPNGPLTGALNAIRLWLNGKTEQYTLMRMREIKDLTVDDLRALKEPFEIMLEQGARSTAGSAQMIEMHLDQYDSVIRVSDLLKTQDAPDVQ